MYALLFALVDDLGLDDRQADVLVATAERAVALANQDPLMPLGADDAPGFDFEMHHRTRRPYLSEEDLRPSPSASVTRPRSGGAAKGRKKSRWGRLRSDRDRPATIAGRYLSATMLRRSQESAHWMAILRPLDNDDVGRIVRATFDVAVPRYFPPGADLRELAAVAVETRKAMTDDLDLMKTEFMLRHAMGEPVVIDDIGVIEQLMIGMLTLAAIADFWGRDEATVNAVIVEAETNLSTQNRPLAVEDS